MTRDGHTGGSSTSGGGGNTGGGGTPAQFIAKWSRTELSERAASQEHFIDLCRLLGQPTPAEHDATGAEYTFEKGVAVTAGASKAAKGDRGFADVWWRGKFGWEYKRKDKYKSFDEAYRQLCQYREALDNPPLLIVSDIARTEIHTNFTGTAKHVDVIELARLDRPDNLDLLRRVFTDPDSFKPSVTTEHVTAEVAEQFGTLARGLQSRGSNPHDTAHFLMKCMFCLFAEDVGLLPTKLFKSLLTKWKDKPARLCELMTNLFAQMAKGGAFGADEIDYFNGGLFDAAPALELTDPEIGVLLIAARQDWSSVEPAIFGTLFERSLDPGKRAQIGAHYTSREDILLVVEPVVMAPLRREWEGVKATVEKQLERRRKAREATTQRQQRDAVRKADEAINDALQGFVARLAGVRVLDPACGSGNFLYVALQQLLNLEKDVITFAAQPELGMGGLLPRVRPTQLHGIEINAYAAELAQVVIWIGYLQWMHDNGFNAPRNPILENLTTIENRDAILDLSDPKNPAATKWPPVDFIIGNPPFLGSKVFRQNGLPDEYVDAMYRAFDLPKTSDLCCYWFELGCRAIRRTKETRAGLLATQGIRGGDSRTVLDRIKKAGGIFLAWSDRDWILDGANVHVSIIGFDSGIEKDVVGDGSARPTINADLTFGLDIRSDAKKLAENRRIGFMADTKGNAFEAPWATFRPMLALPNPNGRPNTDVIRPWFAGKDVAQRPRSIWIIDFGTEMSETDASKYEAPFEYVRANVYPIRSKNRREAYRRYWWRHVEPRPAMRVATRGLDRVLATVLTSPHRSFAWLDPSILPDHKLVVFARSDDYFFGVLHCAVHELWARATGAEVRDVKSGFTYIPSKGFETFPLPWPPGKEPADHPAYRRISDAARQLNESRERWLNPPEWIEPLARAVDALDKFDDVPAPARPLIRQSAIMAMAAKDARLKKRTLTNLYNERPTWLKLAHEKLDRAVLAAYVATDPAGGWSEDWAEVWRDTGAGQPLPAGHVLVDRRTKIDQGVLAGLLNLNRQRG